METRECGAMEACREASLEGPNSGQLSSRSGEGTVLNWV